MTASDESALLGRIAALEAVVAVLVFRWAQQKGLIGQTVDRTIETVMDTARAILELRLDASVGDDRAVAEKALQSRDALLVDIKRFV